MFCLGKDIPTRRKKKQKESEINSINADSENLQLSENEKDLVADLFLIRKPCTTV